MNRNTSFIFLILITVLVSRCATYHLSTRSLLEQFADTKKEQKVNIIYAFPLVFPGMVTGNDLDEIKVLDKNGNESTIPVTHHTGVRITKNDGKKNTFYFDTLIIQDSTITGKKDHFLGINIVPINLNDIKKIELQK
ncbi:MAG: hypothetical protein KKB74_06920 [Bacteroidetes bacterium]|nr:hypothetical protein [Bacteroidota bacterium]